MRFCCPQCGTGEDILVDRKPLCLACRVEMIVASDYADVYMSPYTAIRRMTTISESEGTEVGRTHGRFQKEREAWATGVLAIAISKLDAQQYWIEIETANSTPDTSLHRIDQSSGHNVIQTYSIEVADWEEHVADIMEVIRKKCSRAYPKHYLLVVHARHVGKVLNPDEIEEKLKLLPSPFLEIWIVGRIGEDHLVAARVRPAGHRIVVSRTDLKEAEKQTAFMKKSKRGPKPGFCNLGATYLPLPKIDKGA